mgnify:CR=1 FL=1
MNCQEDCNYQVDSQGNSPCQNVNTCYDDWFLPAGNNTNATGQLNCLYDNRVAIGGFANVDYWSSTEFDWDFAFSQKFDSVSGVNNNDKNSTFRVRCIRAFTATTP